MWPAFITIEGGEGSGKSTLVSHLKEALEERGYEVVATREPGGCALSESIRSLLLHGSKEVSISPEAELQLFLAARVQHIQELILPALKLGKLVLCDRFNDSTIAYQGVARGLGREFVETLCLLSCQGVVPSLTLFLNLPIEQGFSRIQKMEDRELDRMESAGDSFHRHVLEGLKLQADLYPERIVALDATASKESIAAKGLAAILTHLEKRRKL